MTGSAASTVGRALRHWHWLIWLTVLLAGALALGVAHVRPPVYEASALVSIDESTSQSQGFDVAMQADQFLAQRFISMGSSRDVLQAVCARERRGCDTTALGRQVRVTTPRATAQLVIVADASSPQTAARLANETADALIARNRALVNDQTQPQRTYLQGQLKQVGDQIALTLQQTTAADAAGRPNAAGVQQLTFLHTQYSNIYQRLQDLDVTAAQRANVLTVQQRATPPRAPIDPDPVRYLLIGLAGGLVVGPLAALTAELLRRRIRDASELAEAAHTDVVVDLARGGGPTQYGLLARVGRAEPGERPWALMLVASTERDRVNDLARELARVLAAARQQVLVVPAAEPGKGGPERGTAGSPELLVAHDGGRTASSSDLEQVDVAIHCSLPPMQDSAFALREPAPERALVVATRGLTKFSEARATADMLRAVGVQVAAAVLLPRRMRPASLPAVKRPRLDRTPATKVATK